MIGLGTGTIAAAREGDVYRFYDIDSRVMQIALQEFTYLADSKAKIELALGDARLTLEREEPQDFDVLVDAFSSDAIPVHLITREALAVYLRHVKPDGIVAFHVSNRFLDLVPVVARLAKENGACAPRARRPRRGGRFAPLAHRLGSRLPRAGEAQAPGDSGAHRGRGGRPARLADLDRRLLNLIQILK